MLNITVFFHRVYLWVLYHYQCKQRSSINQLVFIPETHRVFYRVMTWIFKYDFGKIQATENKILQSTVYTVEMMEAVIILTMSIWDGWISSMMPINRSYQQVFSPTQSCWPWTTNAPQRESAVWGGERRKDFLQEEEAVQQQGGCSLQSLTN